MTLKIFRTRKLKPDLKKCEKITQATTVYKKDVALTFNFVKRCFKRHEQPIHKKGMELAPITLERYLISVRIRKIKLKFP